MSGMTQPVPAASAGFPVTTALGLQGMTVVRDLGVAFGLVVRSMGMVKSLGAGFKAMRPGRSQPVHRTAGGQPTARD
jgi:uncharacterized protein YbjQ (UPF0145 family)